MLPSEDGCDDCVPDYARIRPVSLRSTYASYLLFLFTFTAAALLALRRILPKLSIDSSRRSSVEHHDAQLPLHSQDVSSIASNARRGSLGVAPSLAAKRAVHVTFAVNIGLSAVLVELLLCEISNAFDPLARSHALKIVLPSLMILLILVAPALELQSLLAASGLTFSASGKGRVRTAWFFEGLGLTLWLFAFWYLGKEIVDRFLKSGATASHPQGFVEGCLERIGVTGIALMAALSGFAAVSAVWQTFMVTKWTVSEADIIRRQKGLEATVQMLENKHSRLRALGRRASTESSTRGIFKVVIGGLRGTGDSKDRSTLGLEIKGLESMRVSILDSLYLLRARKEEQDRRKTVSGKFLLICTYTFAVYCVIRLFSVTFNIFRRFINSTSSSTDPVTSILSVLVKHWDPTLDHNVWTRQISFLLSGVMLFAAFNSALQTFLILGRAFPGLAITAAAFRDATTLALLISQVVATYVISAALMLCSNLPKDVSSIIVDALGTPLDSSRIDAWFETSFLLAAVFTAAGIFAGKQMRDTDDPDGLGDIELGKRS